VRGPRPAASGRQLASPLLRDVRRRALDSDACPEGDASDNTFFAPAVTGCGPGGVANIAVDEAIDASAGLPAASGANSLSLSGTFQIAITSAGEDSALPQPQNNPRVLLSAFRASVGLPPSSRQEAVHRISIAEMRHSLGFK
jgi:hypothetical protein